MTGVGDFSAPKRRLAQHLLPPQPSCSNFLLKRRASTSANPENSDRGAGDVPHCSTGLGIEIVAPLLRFQTELPKPLELSCTTDRPDLLLRVKAATAIRSPRDAPLFSEPHTMSAPPKPPKGNSPAQTYLLAYNAASALLWTAVLGRVVLLIPLVGITNVFGGVDDFVRWVQTLALAEVGHAAFGECGLLSAREPARGSRA